MTFVAAVSAFLNLNILLVIGFVCVGVFAMALRLLRLNLNSINELKIHYAIILFVLGIALAQPLLPHEPIFQPAAKIWSAPSMKSFSDFYAQEGQVGYLSLPNIAASTVVETDKLSAAWFGFGVVLFLLSVFLMCRDLFRLCIIKRRSYSIRRINGVNILVNDSIAVPFSYWLPGQANIILPTFLIAKSEDCKIAIAHEIQHHRHGDTKWVYLLWALRWICVVNPIIYFWNRWISEVQEFACDETLVDQNKVDSKAYARCLIQVAQTSIHQKHIPVCATGLVFLTSGNLLKRRIEKMFKRNFPTQVGRSISVAFLCAVVALMSGVSFASKGLVQDRRVSMAQARQMGEKVKGDFPVVINDRVLEQLNKYIGTPEGREFMKEALLRMKIHELVINEYLEKYNMPEELKAIPLIESGYQNLEPGKNPGYPSWKAAGLWQFIVSTARNYGLIVNDDTDERLNIPLETDAAMRLLQSDKLRFNDWQLAVLAYNMGESAVQKGINATGSRNAWTLIRNGYEGDKNYLAKFMAGVLIIRNPESVQ